MASQKKNCLYDQCAKVPFVISYPKFTKSAIVTDQPVAHIDLTATIADLAGATPNTQINGKSLKTILMEPNTQIHGGILIEVDRGGKQFGIRTKQYKYWEGAGGAKLFDMIKDPKELTNLIDKPDMKSVQEDLVKKLALLKDNKHIPPDNNNSSITPSGSSPTPTVTGSPPLPTPTTSGATISLTVSFHGIGNIGDSSNPSDTSLSNKDPVAEHKEISAQFFDENNKHISEVSGKVSYDKKTGKYIGTVPAPSLTGTYLIKVHSPGYLRKQHPQFFRITQGQSLIAPPLSLITGDINNDNILNIHDYNALLICHDNAGDQECPENTDLNSDGVVDNKDINLWLREVLVIKGD